MTKRIIVVDDERAVRDSFALALTDEDYQVITAASGEEGLVFMRDRRPDLVFLDLRMPGIDGVETLRRLRCMYPDGLPVYIVTAFRRDFVDQLKHADAEGLNFELLDKPVDREQIRHLVRAVLEGPCEG